MYWVIQENIAKEERHRDLLEALTRYDQNFELVNVVPFSHEMTPDVNVEGPVVVMGSISLAQKVAPRKGWAPGAFMNDNFDFNVWADKWQGHLLNDDALIGPFRTIPMIEGATEFFIRPVLDNKAFTGTVMDFWDYQTWRGRLSAGEESSDLNFDLDEEVLVASVKKLYNEIRFFIVDGKIASSSMYRLGDQTWYHFEEETDPEATEFVEARIADWVPDDAFVMDIALTEDGYKVIEINCLNCSGFYKIDVDKLVRALILYFEK